MYNLAIPSERGQVNVDDSFLDEKQADYFLEQIQDTVEFVKQPNEGRATALYGHAPYYRYAKHSLVKPIPWNGVLMELKEIVETKTSHRFNVCLLNYYPTGKTEFRYHSDREELYSETPIIVVYLGGERNFEFRPIDRSHPNINIVSRHGSLMSIDSSIHQYYLHGRPKDSGQEQASISLTFRWARPAQVVHCKKDQFDIYIGRPSEYGNPFVIGKDGTRDDVIKLYRKWFNAQSQEFKDKVAEKLKGKVLCHCTTALVR